MESSFNVELSSQLIHYIVDGGLATLLGLVLNSARKARAEKRRAQSEETQQYNQARLALDNARVAYDKGNMERLQKVEGDLKQCRDECSVQVEEGRHREMGLMREVNRLEARLARVEGRYEGLTKISVSDLGAITISPSKPNDPEAQIAVT